MAFSGTKRYLPIRLIGAGGMGEVYEVEDRETKGRVALKVVSNSAGNALIRFKREFRALCDMHHDNLVQLFEMDSEGGHWFFTMEYVDGVDFLSYVWPTAGLHGDSGSLDSGSQITEPTIFPDRPGRFRGYDEGRLLDALRQLANGLMALHEAGLVHRDVKPGNVLVTKAGRVVLLDFGLVKSVQRDELSMDTIGDIAGTIPYMAPELAAGAEVTSAVDWYSVGVLVYQALTGRFPFEGAPLEVLVKKQSEMPEPPQSLNPDCHPALASIAMKLLDNDPGRRATGEDLLRVLGRASGDSRSLVSATMSLNLSGVFVGRAGEVMHIASAWGKVLHDDVRVVLLEGESGIGKTSLMNHFLEGVLDGEYLRPGSVFRGRCYERESMAYKAFDAVIDRLSLNLARMPDEELAFLLPEDIWYLAAIFPALNRIRLLNDPRYRRVESGDPLVARRRAFHAFGTLLARLSRHSPVILAIDDLQWADQDSMELLNAAVTAWVEEAGRPARILLIATMRPRVALAAVKRTLAKLQGRGLLDVIRLEPLEREASESLVAQLLSSGGGLPRDDGMVQGWVETIVAESAGNPFLMGEMAQFVRVRSEQGDLLPGEVIDLAEVVARRIEELESEARLILSHVAVAGEPIAQELLADSVGMSPGSRQWRRHVARLRFLRLVRYQGFRGDDVIEIYHDRTRDAVLELLESDELREIHEDLARAMDRAAGMDPETLARHWLLAGESDKAKSNLIRAAGESSKKLAFGRAANLLSRAIELESDKEVRAKLYMDMGEALVNDGRPAEAIDAFNRASETEDANLRIRALLAAVANRLKAGYIRQGLTSLAAVLKELGFKAPSPGTKTLLSVGMKRLRLKIRGLKFQPRERSQVSAQDLNRLEVLWSLASGLSLVDPVLSAGFHTRLLLDALDFGLSDYIAVALAIEAGTTASFGADRLTEARRLVTKAEGLVAHSDDVRLTGRLMMAKGFIAYFAGDWEDCERHLREALDLFRNKAYGMGWEISGTLSFLGWSLMMQGRFKELREMVDREMRRAKNTGDRLLSANFSTSLGLVWLASARLEEAERLIEDAILTWPRDRFQIQHYYVLYAKTELMLYQRHIEPAWEWLENQVPKLKRALLMRVGIVRQEVYRLQGRVALAMAAREEAGGTRRRYLKVVNKSVRNLRKEGLSFTDAWAEHLDATRYWLETGDIQESVARFARAIGALEAANLGGQALAARRTRAVISGDDEDVRRVDELLRQEGVVEPGRLASVLSPGVDHREDV